MSLDADLSHSCGTARFAIGNDVVIGQHKDLCTVLTARHRCRAQ